MNKEDSESPANGIQLFHLMGHYITVVCSVDIINVGPQSNRNNTLGCVFLSEALVL